jgi:hypothetical protein
LVGLAPNNRPLVNYLRIYMVDEFARIRNGETSPIAD